MTHSIVLELPEEIYAPLIAKATRNKRKIEEIALEALAESTQTEMLDPLEKFIGAFESNVPDWAEKHDEYLGEELTKTHDDK